MHHIISDAWSLNVLLGEIFTLYEAYRQDKPSPLAPLPLQYADFALWQRQWLQGEVLQTQIDYWKQQLRGATPVSLPTDHPRPLIQTNHGARLTFELPTDLSNQLQALSREQDCTLFMTLLAAFQLLLSRYTGQTDIVVGTDIANRTHIETEQLIGFFINLLPLRTKLQSTATFSTILRQVRETVLDAYTHQDLPFDMLVDLLRLERRSNEIPLVRVLFVLQNAPRAQLEFSSLKFASFMGERMTAKFEVALFMWQGSRGLQGLVIYNTDLFNASTIKNMTDHFAVLLRKLIAHFDEPVKTLDISTEEEKMQKIEEKKRRIDNKMDKLKSKKSEEIYSVAKNDLLLQ